MTGLTEEQLKKQMIITLHETQGIGWHTIKKAVDRKLWRISDLDATHFITAGFRKEQAAAAAQRLQEAAWEKTSASYSSINAVRITIMDKEYPQLLKEIAQPPWVLYAIGKLELLEKPSVAVVGTRQPTAYGKHIAGKLSHDLAAMGLTIVSGMARGIDSSAHEAALDQAGSTIAVLGTSIEKVYPRENQALYRALSTNGLLLSEYPIGTLSHPGLFPQRNRIIAGLSLGTLVIEAATGSGSLITADQALDMQRDVFAVPGPINSPKSMATNDLIRQGAKLVMEARDIAEEYAMYLPKEPYSSLSKHPQEAVLLSADESKIYELLQVSAYSADELHELSSIPLGLLHSVLINLSIKQMIKQLPGSIYMAL